MTITVPDGWQAAAEATPDLSAPWPFDPDLGLEVRHRIVPDLWPLAVPLGTLKLLPGNPRQGDVPAMRRSLSTYGQRKPVVVNIEHGSRPVVEAGNHTMKAAKAEGWTHLAVVRVRDDPNTELGYALADNRLGELGRFDTALLAEATSRLRAADPGLLFAAGYTGDLPPGQTDPYAEWTGMPDYEVEDQKPAYSLMVHFPALDDLDRFLTLIGKERPAGRGSAGHGVPQLWWPDHDHKRGQFSDEAWQAEEPAS